MAISVACKRAGKLLSVTAIWLLGVLLGIQLISEGLALGYLAWRVRQS